MRLKGRIWMLMILWRKIVVTEKDLFSFAAQERAGADGNCGPQGEEIAR